MNPSAVQSQIFSDIRRLLPPQLPEFLAKKRWFGGKARRVTSTEIVDIVPMRRDGSEALLLIVSVQYAGGGEENYAVPVMYAQQPASGAENDVLLKIHSEQAGKNSVVIDAATDEKFLALLFAAIEHEAAFQGEKGQLRGVRGKEWSRLYANSPLTTNPRVLSGEQSNTSVIYDERFILKFFRRIEAGINPELEIGSFLTEKAHFPHVPHLAGHLEYRDAQNQPITQGILQTFVPNEGDAWRHTMKSVAAFYELVRHREHDARDSAVPPIDAKENPRVPEFARAALDADLAGASLLGRRTAELHLALASDKSDPAFALEPFTIEFQKTFLDSTLELSKVTLNLLRAKRPQLPANLRSKAEEIAQREDKINELFAAILSKPIHAARTRIHGDYHLGQVLYTGTDFVIIDFEGEPARPLAERRVKRSPLQDVAGIMRSFHYAAFAPLLGAVHNFNSADDLTRLTPWAEAWTSWFTTRFLEEYFTTSGHAPYLPTSRQNIDNLLKVHLLEKAIYELGYELNNRPTWVGIPMEGIAGLLAA